MKKHRHKDYAYKEEAVAGTYSSKKELIPGLSKAIEASSHSMRVGKKHKHNY